MQNLFIGPSHFEMINELICNFNWRCGISFETLSDTRINYYKISLWKCITKHCSTTLGTSLCRSHCTLKQPCITPSPPTPWNLVAQLSHCKVDDVGLSLVDLQQPTGHISAALLLDKGFLNIPGSQSPLCGEMLLSCGGYYSSTPLVQ